MILGKVIAAYRDQSPNCQGSEKSHIMLAEKCARLVLSIAQFTRYQNESINSGSQSESIKVDSTATTSRGKHNYKFRVKELHHSQKSELDIETKQITIIKACQNLRRICEDNVREEIKSEAAKRKKQQRNKWLKIKLPKTTDNLKKKRRC